MSKIEPITPATPESIEQALDEAFEAVKEANGGTLCAPAEISRNIRVTADMYRECANSGMTISQAAKHLGAGYSAVWQASDRLNLKFKGQRK